MEGDPTGVRSAVKSRGTGITDYLIPKNLNIGSLLQAGSKAFISDRHSDLKTPAQSCHRYANELRYCGQIDYRRHWPGRPVTPFKASTVYVCESARPYISSLPCPVDAVRRVSVNIANNLTGKFHRCTWAALQLVLLNTTWTWNGSHQFTDLNESNSDWRWLG